MEGGLKGFGGGGYGDTLRFRTTTPSMLRGSPSQVSRDLVRQSRAGLGVRLPAGDSLLSGSVRRALTMARLCSGQQPLGPSGASEPL